MKTVYINAYKIKKNPSSTIENKINLNKKLFYRLNVKNNQVSETVSQLSKDTTCFSNKSINQNISNVSIGNKIKLTKIISIPSIRNYKNKWLFKNTENSYNNKNLMNNKLKKLKQKYKTASNSISKNKNFKINSNIKLLENLYKLPEKRILQNTSTLIPKTRKFIKKIPINENNKYSISKNFKKDEIIPIKKIKNNCIHISRIKNFKILKTQTTNYSQSQRTRRALYNKNWNFDSFEIQQLKKEHNNSVKNLTISKISKKIPQFENFELNENSQSYRISNKIELNLLSSQRNKCKQNPKLQNFTYNTENYKKALNILEDDTGQNLYKEFDLPLSYRNISRIVKQKILNVKSKFNMSDQNINNMKRKKFIINEDDYFKEKEMKNIVISNANDSKLKQLKNSFYYFAFKPCDFYSSVKNELLIKKSLKGYA